MRRQATVQAELYCEECDFKMVIARKASLKKEGGHMKHMWCGNCQKVTGFIEETRDSSLDFWEQWQSEQLGVSSEGEEESIQ